MLIDIDGVKYESELNEKGWFLTTQDEKKEVLHITPDHLKGFHNLKFTGFDYKMYILFIVIGFVIEPMMALFLALPFIYIYYYKTRLKLKTSRGSLVIKLESLEAKKAFIKDFKNMKKGKKKNENSI